MTVSPEEEERRAENRDARKASEDKKQSRLVGTGILDAKAPRKKRPRVIASASQDSSVLGPSSPFSQSTAMIPSSSGSSFSHSVSSSWGLVDLNSFDNILRDANRSAFSIRETLSRVRAARRQEQGIARQLEDREDLYSHLLKALEDEAQTLESAKERAEIESENEEEERSKSKPTVEVTSERETGDSDSSGVGESTSEEEDEGEEE